MSDPSTSAHLGKAEYVAQELLRFIISSKIAADSSIGTETDLLSRYDVSRPTLRESLRILESQGVVERRPGPGGGIIARKPAPGRVAHALSIFLHFNKVPFGKALMAREVIEPALASEAALHGSEADFVEMRTSIARMKECRDHDAFMGENRVFHGIVARASGNKVLEVFWQALSLMGSGDFHGIRYTANHQKHVVAAHQRILQACSDATGAAQAMAEHVGELENLVRRRYEHLLDAPPDVVGLGTRSAG